MSLNLPKVAGNKRIVLIGKTRSGKSTIARLLLKMKLAEGWWVVIVDPKKDWMTSTNEHGHKTRIPYGELTKDFKGSVDRPIRSDTFNPECKVMIIEPVEWDKRMDALVDAVMAHGYVIFYIDEIRQLANANKSPIKLVILYTQGGAHNVGCWAGNQRPKGIPEDMKSQAEIWIVLYVTKFEDRVAIAAYMPKNKYSDYFVVNNIPYYWFMYYDDQMDGPVILPPLQIASTQSKGSRVG